MMIFLAAVSYLPIRKMRILLPFWRGVPEGCFYQDFHQGVAEALRELGHEAVQFPFVERGRLQPDEADLLFPLVEAGQFDALLDLACWGRGLSRIGVSRNGVREPLFDAFGVAYLGWLFDQPYNQAINLVASTRLYGAYPDLGHSDQVRLIFPGLKLRGEIFAPPAIRPSNSCSGDNWWTDRDIDVLYVGNLVTEALQRSWNRRVSDRATVCHPGFCDTLADAVLSEPERSLHLSLQLAIAELSPLPAGFDISSNLRVVESFLRHTFRRDAVAALAGSGVRMRVVGKGWDRLGLPANVEFGAETDYAGFFRLAARAKICLDASTYLDGANDRVFSYALNRAVCFTNAAGYLRSTFGEDGGMCFYSMRNLSELGERVKALLARPEALQEAGIGAGESVLSAHTWRHRVENILDSIRLQPGVA
jgi:hypothetical protein